MPIPTIAYLDAGAGAALAAVIASGAVGARVALGSAREKLRRGRGRQQPGDQPSATEAGDR